MFTKEQKKILSYTEKKAAALFRRYHAPAHGFDHSRRVKKWAIRIAQAERANVFLAAFTAVLHDIGRTIEKKHPGVRHHELSYIMLRVWFREDRAFDALTRTEKLQSLYAIRYHWNDAANGSKIAIILRDADKLDSLGNIGIKRSREYHTDDAAFVHDFRYKYQFAYCLVTKEAKKIVREYRMMEQVDRYHHKLLKAEIKDVTL